ncbi:MAG: GNAT family N-acetyltransferase [Geobacter sp.]|nr:GNAT family N-acetyltransferase [Geobacter sp.]
MPSLLLIESPEQLESLAGAGDITPLGGTEFSLHAPDTHWVVLDEQGKMTARVSLWWSAVPPYPGERLGVIGHYAALDAASAAQLLAHSCRELASRGCTLAIGPMDGNTWRKYRFVTERGTEPPFFLEPDNPDDYPRHFETAGFASLARYYSNLDPDLGWSIRNATQLEARISKLGITFRHLDQEDFENELKRIYDLSVAGFGNNFLYTPISREEFQLMYEKIRPFIMPELVLFAEQEGKHVGFLFALPDMLRAQRGEALDTVILKSMAVLPEWNGKGIGGLLMARATANAGELGFRRAIHALMHEDNTSRGMSGRHGIKIRQYSLFARRLP